MHDDMSTMRHEYGRRPPLRVEAMADDPFSQFDVWLGEAVDRGIDEPNAMVLSTVDADGRPRARTVLLKGVDAEGFRFFTNRDSQKGRDLATKPHGAVTFPWPALERQVVARGPVSPVPDAESDAYFASRPFEARVAAWASSQSRELASREDLESSFASFRERFADGVVPRPPHWGGYRLAPVEVEFWQGGRHRLHDRLVYRRASVVEPWRIVRLAP